MNTPENITELQPNEIFVFGSNNKGNHIGGAAKVAVDRFGAVMGKGLGLQGQSYAFPTLNEDMQQLSIGELSENRDIFYQDAIWHPELTFYLTRVGTGIAGYSEETMKSLFRVKLSNIVYPEGF